MYSIGILLGVLISIFYPLSIAIIVKFLKFKDKIWKYFLIAFIMGVFFFFIGLIRTILLASLPTEVAYWVSLILGAFVEEGMKLLGIYLLLRKIIKEDENGMYIGFIIGLGFACAEMINILPAVPLTIINSQDGFWANFLWLQVLNTSPFKELFSFNMLVYLVQFTQYTSLTGIFGIPLWTLYERLIVTPFHPATAIIIGYGFMTDRPSLDLNKIKISPLMIFYLLATGIHIFLNSFAILYNLQVIGLELTEIIITAITIPSFIITLWYMLKKRDDFQ